MEDFDFAHFDMKSCSVADIMVEVLDCTGLFKVGYLRLLGLSSSRPGRLRAPGWGLPAGSQVLAGTGSEAEEISRSPIYEINTRI